MICPKCGFDQPDDAYCAFCGVSIKKYRQDKRKKQYVVYGVVCFVLIAGIFIVVNAHRQAETPGLVTRYAEKKGEDQIRDVALPETGQGQFEVGQESQTGKTTPPSQPSAAEEEVVSSTERLEDEGPGAAEASQELPSAEPTVGSVPEETGGEQLTARDWFEKGRALDDESEAEVEFYKKALEVDPEFAPAYYRLGAIHFRRAMYELADQEFVKFLAHASESQRQTYSIYVYYSPSDMERLSEAVATEKASGEGEEQEASAEAPAAEEEVSAGAEAVEKAPEEAEEGQTETAGEAARATSEGTEEAETEIPAENTSEAEEEVEYGTGNRFRSEEGSMHRLLGGAGLVLAVVVSIIFPVVVFAYENEPEDFRGVEWDTHIEKLPDMEIVLDGGDLKAYTRKGEEMRLEEADLSALHYIFYKDHFYCVHIEFNGLANFDKIKDVLFKTYGDPGGTQYYDNRFVWSGGEASITLEYDSSIDQGELGYKFLPIDREIVMEEESETEEDAE